MSPPTRLKYQKETGILLLALRSDASHWTIQRPKNNPWPRNPIAIQMVSVVVIIGDDPDGSGVRGGPAILIAQDPVLHPPDRNEVIEAFEEAIADAIFGDAVGPRVMADRDFSD